MDEMIGKAGQRPKKYLNGKSIRDRPIFNMLMIGNGYYVAIPGNDDPRNYEKTIATLKASITKAGSNEAPAKASDKNASR